MTIWKQKLQQLIPCQSQTRYAKLSDVDENWKVSRDPIGEIRRARNAISQIVKRNPPLLKGLLQARENELDLFWEIDGWNFRHQGKTFSAWESKLTQDDNRSIIHFEIREKNQLHFP